MTVTAAEGVYTQHDPELLRVTGTNTLISDVVINTDSTTNCMTPVQVNGGGLCHGAKCPDLLPE